MIFDTLSKELYPLTQGLSENVAELRICLSQQVQILQSEYLGRIQLKHMEEMKHDCFYEGLNPEYWQMLAQKVDGEHPASYSNLLLAAQKLEGWAEVRDLLPPKTLWLMDQTWCIVRCQGIVLLLCKLKGNCIFCHSICDCWKWHSRRVSRCGTRGEGEPEPSADGDIDASAE